MPIRIVTDSTCDLPQEIIDRYQISVVPLIINIGEKEFRDGVDLSRPEFYKRLPQLKPSPTTAVPGSETFRHVYQRLAASGATEILSLHVSASLSAVVDVARLAASEISSIKVNVFDSRQLSLGLGFNVLSAAQAAAEGLSIPQIRARLEEQVRRTRVFAALDTLEYVRRSGRISLLLSTIGSMLHIKPIMEYYEGSPAMGRACTRTGALKRLVELLKKYGPYERVAMLHTGAAERAAALLDEVRHLLPSGPAWITEVNPIMGTHLGPNLLGFILCYTS
jgi:DegV family protein with EDD domain